MRRHDTARSASTAHPCARPPLQEFLLLLRGATLLDARLTQQAARTVFTHARTAKLPLVLGKSAREARAADDDDMDGDEDEADEEEEEWVREEQAGGGGGLDDTGGGDR